MNKEIKMNGEKELKPCPFCGACVGFYEADPGAPFPGYYLMVIHLQEDGSFDHENKCFGNHIDWSPKVCTDFNAFLDVESAKGRYSTPETAREEIKNKWNSRATSTSNHCFEMVTKETVNALEKCLEMMEAQEKRQSEEFH